MRICWRCGASPSTRRARRSKGRGRDEPNPHLGARGHRRDGEGHDIVCVDIVPEQVAAIGGPGLKIEGPIEEFTVAAPAFTPQELKGRFDRIFLCVKAQHTAGAAEALKPFLAEDGYVLSLQN